MADVTNIKMIINNTFNLIAIKNGDSASQLFSVPASGAWTGDIWVPWIAGQSEGNKAINIIDGAPSQILIFLFQDYWNPPGKDAIKYCNAPFSYNDATEVPGNNQGGGNKILILNPSENGFALYMK
ncbi:MULTISPECIES: hypothetical protein [Burkholderia]|uniref:hypothetical protein n=1 Tax=Burkholderia TaxID=32008 RepID=UPI0009E7A452|nr:MULTISPECIES: hypothetical protein [Burkholderia]